MTELDHLQADVLKDLSKMVIAGAGIILLLALLLWGLVTSAEAVAVQFCTDKPSGACDLETRTAVFSTVNLGAVHLPHAPNAYALGGSRDRGRVLIAV